MNRSQYILAHTIRSKVDITYDENFHKDFLKTVAALAREMQSFSILLRGLLDRGFCSLAVLDPRVGHTMDVLSPFSLSSVILIDSSTESPVHVLMLSIQAVRGLPLLRAPGIVPCIISFSRQLLCFLMV